MRAFYRCPGLFAIVDVPMAHCGRSLGMRVRVSPWSRLRQRIDWELAELQPTNGTLKTRPQFGQSVFVQLRSRFPDDRFMMVNAKEDGCLADRARRILLRAAIQVGP